MNWKAILSTAGSAFLTGAGGYLTTHVAGIPTTTQAIEGLLGGALLGGIIAVYHLYQPVPAKTAAP